MATGFFNYTALSEEWVDEDGCYNSTLFKITEQYNSYTEVRSRAALQYSEFR